MKNVQEYIETGILELYVLGLTSEAENLEIEALSQKHPEIRIEIDQISDSIIRFGKNRSHDKPRLSPNVKPLLMAIIDYTERMKNGEQPTSPPTLDEYSKPSDFSTWINRKDMVFDDSFGDIYAKIIGYSPEVMTAIVWLKEGSPHEVHDKEYEKFLILEGSCNIVTKDRVIPLETGSYFQVPLHLGHTVEVTSEIPCKLILQRMAA